MPSTEPDMTPYLPFTEDNRVTGFAGCNQFTGVYETYELLLSFKPLATTENARTAALVRFTAVKL